MDAKAILDGLLDKSQRATTAGMQMAEERNIIPPAGDERTAMLKGAGAGALAAGAVALLFGSKGTRKFVGKAAKLGGTAAIGGLAYKAYTDWQSQQSQQTPPSAAPAQINNQTAQPASLNLNQFDVGTPINDLADQAAAKRSEALMQAMITAARADGHVDDEEMNMITQQINNLGLEQDVTRFLLAEMSKPVDVNRIAALADTPETAAELYIASAMVVDMDDAEERVYLDKLAVALNLDASLVLQLEAPLRSS
ncbi:MAG: tellurite resistance TerB family protein [Granulosicoccus sp.]